MKYCCNLQFFQNVAKIYSIFVHSKLPRSLQPQFVFYWSNPGLFLNILSFPHDTNQHKLIKRRWCAWDSNPGRQMEAQTNPVSFGSTPMNLFFTYLISFSFCSVRFLIIELEASLGTRDGSRASSVDKCCLSGCLDPLAIQIFQFVSKQEAASFKRKLE